MVNSGDGRHNNHFYSINIGWAHVVFFSTEFYYSTENGWDQIQRQYEWLENDLKEANKPENRAHRPWILTMGHRPLYCAKKEDSTCHDSLFERSFIRNGIHFKNTGDIKYGLEQLFYKHGVDLQFYGHEHYYHRMFPIYNNKVFNGTKHNPYENPKAPIHIISGSAVRFNLTSNQINFLKFESKRRVVSNDTPLITKIFRIGQHFVITTTATQELKSIIRLIFLYDKFPTIRYFQSFKLKLFFNFESLKMTFI